MLRILTGFCLACLLLSFGATSLLAKGQPTIDISEVKASTSNISAIAGRFPVMEIGQVIPSAITSEEIAVREQQIQILNDLESIFKLKLQPGTGKKEDILSLQYFRLTNQVHLLQAKQLLRLKK
jgi:hypothetical protein